MEASTRMTISILAKIMLYKKRPQNLGRKTLSFMLVCSVTTTLGNSSNLDWAFVNPRLN